MGHESRIEPWSPVDRVLLAGFGTDRLRCNQAMKTTGGENQNLWTRAFGAEGQNGSCSNKWAAKQEKLQPLHWCFFLPSPFIELTRTYRRRTVHDTHVLWWSTTCHTPFTLRI